MAKTKFLIIISLLLIFGCKPDTKTLILDQIKKEAVSLNNIRTEINILYDEKGKISIELCFLKPYRIVDKEQQELLIKYLMYRFKSFFSPYEKIRFIVFLKDEQDFNRQTIEFDQSELEKLFEFYDDNEIFVELIEFTMKRFSQSTIIGLRGDIELMNKEFSNIPINTGFYDFLKSHYLEIKDKKLGDVSNRFLLIYFFNKDASKELKNQVQNNAKNNSDYLSSIWRISTGNDIEKYKTEFEEYMNSLPR